MSRVAERIEGHLRVEEAKEQKFHQLLSEIEKLKGQDRRKQEAFYRHSVLTWADAFSEGSIEIIDKALKENFGFSRGTLRRDVRRKRAAMKQLDTPGPDRVDEDIQPVAREEPLRDIDTSVFNPLTSEEVINILGLTIKRDEENKLIVFLACLSAYTEGSQMNISFNAPSSTGKSYIPTEIAGYFPKEDVIEIGYCSPTAFFHDVGIFDKEKGGYILDLSRKNLIFLDQPHALLLQHLRPLLSHDKKEIRMKITDKSQKAGLKTKNIYLRGFPSVIFCTAGLKIDEQEVTRFLLLSPDIDQEKIRAAIFEKIDREADSEAYLLRVEDTPGRKLLKERIRAIKQEGVRGIKIGCPEKIKKAFFERHRVLKPRHQRDIGRIISLVKAFALLNMWFRERQGSSIVANEGDIDEAFKVWDGISESQEVNLPPYIYQLFREVIEPAWREKNPTAEGDNSGEAGLTRRDIWRKHQEVNGRPLADWQLRQQIIPMLESAGLITQEPDPQDRRKMLIYPTTSLTISPAQNNSESHGGVNSPPEKYSELSGRVNPSQEGACEMCGKREWWISRQGKIICRTCHPPVPGAEVQC